MTVSLFWYNIDQFRQVNNEVMPTRLHVCAFGRLEKTTRSSPHHVAQHRPTGSEITPPYALRSSRFGSEPPSVEDDVDVWRYAILELHARNDDDDSNTTEPQRPVLLCL